MKTLKKILMGLAVAVGIASAAQAAEVGDSVSFNNTNKGYTGSAATFANTETWKITIPATAALPAGAKVRLTTVSFGMNSSKDTLSTKKLKITVGESDVFSELANGTGDIQTSTKLGDNSLKQSYAFGAEGAANECVLTVGTTYVFAFVDADGAAVEQRTFCKMTTDAANSPIKQDTTATAYRISQLVEGVVTELPSTLYYTSIDGDKWWSDLVFTKGGQSASWVGDSDVQITVTGTPTLQSNNSVGNLYLVGSGNADQLNFSSENGTTIAKANLGIPMNVKSGNFKIGGLALSDRGQLTFDASAGSYAIDKTTTKTTIRTAEDKIYFKGAGGNGVTLSYGTDMKSSLSSHLVFDGGTHAFTWGMNSASANFSTTGTLDNPTVLVKAGTALNFTMRDLCGWSGSLVEGSIIRVADGATMNFLPNGTSTMYMRGRLVLEPGSTLTYKSGGGDFKVFGGNQASSDNTKAQIYVPAPTSANKVATFAKDANSSKNVDFSTGATAITVAGDATLNFNTPFTGASGKTMTKYGTGTLKLMQPTTFAGNLVCSAGTLATAADITFSGSGNTCANGSTVRVESGTFTYNTGTQKGLNADIYIAGGAKFVQSPTSRTNDQFDYSNTHKIDVYGTLDFGTSRWSLQGKTTVNLYPGALLMGAGEGSYGAIDAADATVTINAKKNGDVGGEATIAARLRPRANPGFIFNVDDGMTLKLAGSNGDKYNGFNKTGAGTLEVTSDSSYSLTGAVNVNGGTLKLAKKPTTGTITVASGATLEPARGLSLGALDGSGQIKAVLTDEEVAGGSTALALFSCSSKADALSIAVSDSNGYEYVATKSGDAYVVDTTSPKIKAQIGDIGYPSAAAAFAAVAEGQTVKLLANCSEALTATEVFTFDFNGFTFGGTLAIEEGGLVDITKTLERTMFWDLLGRTSGNGTIRFNAGTGTTELRTYQDKVSLTLGVNVDFLGTGTLRFVGEGKDYDKTVIPAGKAMTFENGTFWATRSEFAVSGRIVAKEIWIGHQNSGTYPGKVTVGDGGVVKAGSVTFRNYGGTTDSLLTVSAGGTLEFTQSDTAAILLNPASATYAVNIGGTLKADASSWHVGSDVAIALAAGAAFDAAADKVIAVASPISGSGSVSVTGAGEVVLNGANTDTCVYTVAEDASLTLGLGRTQTIDGASEGTVIVTLTAEEKSSLDAGNSVNLIGVTGDAFAGTLKAVDGTGAAYEINEPTISGGKFVVTKKEGARMSPFCVTNPANEDWTAAGWTDSTKPTALEVRPEDWDNKVSANVTVEEGATKALATDRALTLGTLTLDNAGTLAVSANGDNALAADELTINNTGAVAVSGDAITVTDINDSASTGPTTIAFDVGATTISAGSDTILNAAGTGHYTIGADKKLTVKSGSFAASQVSNDGTLNFDGGTAETPISYTMTGSATKMTLAAGAVVKVIPNANKAYNVTGADYTSRFIISRTDDGTGVASGATIRNLTLVEYITSSDKYFWLERNPADATVDLETRGNGIYVNGAQTVGSLAGTGTVVSYKDSRLTLTPVRPATYEGTSAAIITVGGSAVQTFSGKYTGALTVNEGAQVKLTGSAKPTSIAVAGTVTVDPNGSSMTLSGTLTGAGNIIVEDSSAGANGTVKFTGDRSGFTGTITYKNGTFDLGTGRTMPEDFVLKAGVKVSATQTRVEYAQGLASTFAGFAEGTQITLNKLGGGEPEDLTVDAEGKASSTAGAPQIAGEATLFDVTFDDPEHPSAFKYKAVSGATLQYDTAATFAGEAGTKDCGVYIKHHPYINGAANTFNGLGDFTAVFVGQMSPTANRIFVHFGSSLSSNQGIMIATLEGTDAVGVFSNVGSTLTELKDLSVPNSATARHVYIVTKRTVGDDTVFTIYLDGVKRAEKTIEGAFVLGASDHCGVQVGADFGGEIRKGTYKAVDPDDQTETGVLNVCRIYDYLLTDDQVTALTTEYPYISQGGLYTRTVEGNVDYAAAKSWTKSGEETPEYEVPTGTDVYSPSATLTAGGAGATVTVNANSAIDVFTFNGAAMSFVKDADGTNKITVATAVVNAPVTIRYDVLHLGEAAISLSGAGSLTFDFQDFDLASYFADDKVQITGMVDRNDDKFKAINIPQVAGREAEFRYDDGEYYLFITVTPADFIYDNGWTWNGAAVSEAAVAAHPGIAIVVKSDLEWAIDRTGITVEAGTLTVSSVAQRAAAVTVESGAVLDLNGNNAKEMNLTLAGGKVTYGTTKLGEADQIKVLTLTDDSEINTPVKGQIYAASYNTATTIALGEFTLTKTGADVLQVVNVDVTGTGTIYVKEGEFYGSENTRATNATFKVAEGATLHNRGDKTMTLAKIVGEGGTLNNEGTISAFTLEGTLAIANAGSFGAITLADGATIDIGQKRGLAIAGAGTVNAVLTAEEIATAGSQTIFTTTSEDVVLGTVKDADGNDVACTKQGGAIVVDHAAKIGSVGYFTLQDAMAAATAGQTVTLLKNAELGAPISVAKQVTLDIGAFDVTPATGFTGGDGLFFVNYGGDFTVTGTGTIDASSNANIYEAIKLTVTGETYTGTRAKLTVNANIKGYYYGITGNGGRPGTDIVVSGGTITAVADKDNLAIYNPQTDSTVTIYGGTLTGYLSAIEMRGGTLNVNGGTLKATADVYAVAASGSGTTTKGAAVAIAQHNTQGDLAVTIAGGTLQGLKAVSVANPQNNATNNVAVTLGAASYDGALAFSADGNATVTNSGAEIDAPAGYAWKDGKLVKAFTDGTTYYLTLAEAFEKAADGATVTLLADQTLTTDVAVYAKVPAGKTLTLDLDGKTITATSTFAAAQNSSFVENYGTLTVKGGEGGIAYSAPSSTNGRALFTNCGTLTIVDGSFTQGDGSTAYVVDNLTNGTLWEPVLTVNGGSLVSAGNAAIRQFANSTTKTGTIVVNGGYVEAKYYALQVRNANASKNKASVTITGGEFEATADSYNCSVCSWAQEGEANAEIAITIKGGTFNDNIAIEKGGPNAIEGGLFAKKTYSFDTYSYDLDDYCAGGFAITQSGDPDYPYTSAFFPVKVGPRGCNTLAVAFAAAGAGDKIELFADAELDAPISVAKQVALDIGAFNVTPATGFTGGDGLFFVNYGGDFTVTGTGTIDASSNAKIYEAIKMTVTGETYTGTRAKLTVNANIKGYYYGITGNGGRPGTDITVNGGTITAVADEDNLAIYNPQTDSTVTVNGGTLTGYLSAIEMRGGTLTVTGGTLTATAETYAVAASGSGTTTKGAAVAIAQHSTKGDLAVTIAGGTISGTKAVSVANPQGNDTANVAVTLGAASYTGDLAFTADGNAKVTNTGAEIAAPEGYAWDKNGVLAKCPIKIGTTFYLTLAEAVDAAKEGDTILLVGNVDGGDQPVEVAKAITLDGDVYELTGAGFTGSGKLTVAGGFIGVTALPASRSLVGGKYKNAGWAAEEGYHYADMASSEITGYAKQIIAGASGQTGEKVYPITDGGETPSLVGDLAFTKDELVQKGIVESTATDADIALALNAKGENDRPTWENVVLGLSNEDSLAKPVPTPVQSSDPSKLTLKLANLDVSTTTGAKVTYKVTTTTAAGTTTKTVDGLEAEFALPESGVSYYKFDVTVTPAK